MSKDMSMFKKMKERITDEVNSATNKLQNMQLIDQLASSIGQAQMKNEVTPNQLVPEFPGSSDSNRVSSRNAHFSIIDDEIYQGPDGEDEPNSEFSPQHQLFNENSILRLGSSQSDSKLLAKNGISSPNLMRSLLIPQTVINISELSSDLEDGMDGSNDDSKDLDTEIDLLSINHEHVPVGAQHDKVSSHRMIHYKTKYRDIVHHLRALNNQFQVEKDKLETQKMNLSRQVTALKTELEYVKQQQASSSNQHDSLLSAPTTATENGKTRESSPQPVTKSGTKLKDLEKLLAKCKESLKLKNSQIRVLKDSLSEFEKFKDINQDLKRELGELREAHETWTVSIAENKRIMHQEIESKNAEFARLKGEVNELKNRLTESNNKNQQLKSTLQDLESRLVNTSAAHQKERESLTKELTIAKNNSLRQAQKEFELTLERVKLDLEKTIESLKLELLNKDQQIIKSAERQQELYDKNSGLMQELEQTNKKVKVQLNIIDTLRENIKKEENSTLDLKAELDTLTIQSRQRESELETSCQLLDDQLKVALGRLESTEKLNIELQHRLDEADRGESGECKQLKLQIVEQTEKFQQELHELSAKLELMSTANDDQEKVIKSLQSERDSLSECYKTTKVELDELIKKNESLSRILEENESDIQAQQEQLDNLAAIQHELENSKKETLSILEGFNALKAEFSHKISDLDQLRSQNEALEQRLVTLESELVSAKKQCDDLKKERESLKSLNESFNKQKRQLEEQLVVGILAAMKNLESPNISPGSDKSFDSSNQLHQPDPDQSGKNLPNPITLMDELSSLAFDRCQTYLTTSQRLQAVLLENQMIGEELKRLKEELQNLNAEKALATQCSIEETERLHTENQALIHDQQAYDEKIAQLEDEIEILTKKLDEKKTETEVVPDSTQFEYLKNIVYQFMLGREPLVLARVISAVFRFDKDQVDQICKVQEAVQLATRQNIK